MAKRRHLALSMKNLEESAKLYEDAFDISRVRQSNVAIMPSDGMVSLALLHLSPMTIRRTNADQITLGCITWGS